MALARNIIPEGRLLFRAAAYGILAVIAFALPIHGAWWAGLLLAYMALNLMIAKVVANVSDAIYRGVTRQPLDREVARQGRRDEHFDALAERLRGVGFVQIQKD